MSVLSERFRPTARRPVLLIALLAGVISVGAFAPFGLYGLMPLAMAVLFWLAGPAAPKRAALIGAAFGIGLFGAGSYWILIALSGIGGAPLPLALALLIGLVLLLSAFIAATLACAARLGAPDSAARLVLWLPLIWTAIEWVRSWIFSGFPWFSAGYSQIDGWLVGYAPVFGVFGASWAVALSAGLIAWSVRQPRRAALGGVAGLVAVWLLGAALAQIDWSHPSGPSRRVTLVQGDVAQQVKWSNTAVDQAINRYAGLTAGHWQADLVIWPETAIPAFYRDVAAPLRSLGQQLAAQDTTLLTGLLRADDQSRAIYNSVVAVGAADGFYAKRHLVPFGEYFPVPDFVRRWMAASGMPYADFAAGTADQPTISAAGMSLGISICYEDIFGALIARDVPPADVLINVSEDAWFGRSIGPFQHFEIARMRAVETGRYLLRADNTAVTGIVDPKGRVVDRAPGFTQTVVTGSFRPYAGLTPYARWGNALLLLVLGLTAATAVVVLRRRRRG